MLRADWLRSTSFRNGSRYAIFFLLAVLAIFATTYQAVRHDMRTLAYASVSKDAQGLLTEYNSSGLPALKEATDERVAQTQGYDEVYALTDLAGNVIAGNILNLPLSNGESEVVVHLSPELLRQGEVQGLAIGKTMILKDAKLFVGRDAFQMDETLEILFTYFSVGALITSVLALFLGLVMGRSSAQRIEAISRSTSSIVATGLKERIPLSGTGDEFDRLSSDINIMLDRIQDLMEGIRQISDDIAHELRTPLSRLRQNLEGVLAKRSPNLKIYRQTVQNAIAESENIMGIFSALLRIAQIESGARRSHFKQVNISEIFRDIEEMYRPVIEDAGLLSETNIQEGLLSNGDRELLIQLFSNLIENAIRYIPRGATITLSATSKSENIVAIIADNGPGIPVEEHAKVLRRLYRSEKGRTTQGYGLGLSLVAAIANLHNAKLSLHDNRPGLKVEIIMQKHQVLKQERI